MKPRNKIGLGLLATWLAVAPGSVFAQDDNMVARAQENPQIAKVLPEGSSTTKISHPPKQSNESILHNEEWKKSAWYAAGKHASQHPGISFAVNGHTDDATNQQIATLVKDVIQKKGVNATPFSGKEDRGGASFYFFVGERQFGPVGLDDLIATIDEAVNYQKVMQPDHQASLPQLTADAK